VPVINGEWAHDPGAVSPAGSPSSTLTIDFDFPPRFVVCKISVGTVFALESSHGATTGILNYRRRLADGSDLPVKFHDTVEWDSALWAQDPVMTHVTFGWNAYHCIMRALITLEFWG
jgi:hypothetical protein